MSTIERIAELLGPLERPNLKSVPGELDSISRAANERTAHAELGEAREFAAQLEAIERAVNERSGRSGFEPREPAMDAEANRLRTPPERLCRPW